MCQFVLFANTGCGLCQMHGPSQMLQAIPYMSCNPTLAGMTNGAMLAIGASLLLQHTHVPNTISIHCGCNILLGQLHRLCELITDRDMNVLECARFVIRMRSCGYKASILWRQLQHHLRVYPDMSGIALYNGLCEVSPNVYTFSHGSTHLGIPHTDHCTVQFEPGKATCALIISMIGNISRQPWTQQTPWSRVRSAVDVIRMIDLPVVQSYGCGATNSGKQKQTKCRHLSHVATSAHYFIHTYSRLITEHLIFSLQLIMSVPTSLLFRNPSEVTHKPPYS